MTALQSAPGLHSFRSRAGRLLRSQAFFAIAVQTILAAIIVVPGFYAVYYSETFRDLFFDVRFDFVRAGMPEQKVKKFLGEPDRIEIGNKLISAPDQLTTRCTTWFFQDDNYSYNKIIIEDGKVLQKAQNEFW